MNNKGKVKLTANNFNNSNNNRTQPKYGLINNVHDNDYHMANINNDKDNKNQMFRIRSNMTNSRKT